MFALFKLKKNVTVVELLNTVNISIIKREKENYYERESIRINIGDRFIVSHFEDNGKAHVNLPNTWFMVLNKENYIVVNLTAKDGGHNGSKISKNGN